MVLLNLIVRPTTAYNGPNKIRRIKVDTSQRVEDIVSKLKLEKKGTHFYSKGRELPLNSALASHNIQDGDILESCACPKFSAVLSAVLRDLDAVDRLAEEERTEENVRPLLDGASLDPWPERWSSESIKPRKICLAIIKKVIQRNDRYQDTQVPPCDNLQSLCDFMQTIWRNEGNRSHNTNAQIVKPSAKNRDGKPSICWVLLQNKLDKLQAISSRVSPNQDPLEEFVKVDYARHHSVQSTPRSANRHRTQVEASPQPKRLRRKLLLESSPSSRGAVVMCSACESSPEDSICLDQECPFYKQACCVHCFRGNHPILQRNHERVPLTDKRARVVTREQNRPTYIPEYKSGPYAILATLAEVSEEDSTTREYSLPESRLMKLAQQRCRSNLYDRQARGRNAFTCVESLVEKGLVRKELIPGLSEAKFSLLPPGEAMGRCSLQFERAFERMLQTPTLKNDRRNASGVTTSRIRLLIDRREDATYAERLQDRCLDKGIQTDFRELPAGDYLFATATSQGVECVFPLIIERKSWSDLADSVTGRGKRRLDCVRLDGDRQCAGSCQLCRMKKSGCSKLMFIIEGARCLNRDHEYKCCNENRCKYCREIAERSGQTVVHENLELVLKNLQVEHDCIIHFTTGYNETISSLFMIREILANNIRTEQDQMTYAQFCKNALSKASADGQSHAARSPARGAVTIVKAETFADNIQNGKVEDFITTIAVVKRHSARELVVVDVDDEEPRKRTRSFRQAFGRDVLRVSSDESHSEDEVQVEDQSQDSIEILEDDGWKTTKKSSAGSDPKRGQTPCINLGRDSDDAAAVQVINALAKDDDDVTILEVHPPRIESLKKRKRAPKVNTGATLVPFILLSGMYEYDKDFLDDVNKIWKAIFLSFSINVSQQDFKAFVATKLGESGLFGKESTPLIQRERMIFWCLVVQLTTNARLRITRTSAELCSIRSAWEQNGISQAGTIPPARRELNFKASSPSMTSGCMICQRKIKDNQGIVTPCHHSFHRECISTWMDNSGKRNCPHCNFQGIGLSKDHRTEAQTLRGQERPPRAPGGATCLASPSMTSGCMICQKKIKDNQGMVTPCHHSFHRECISTWIDNSGRRNCPHCNFQGIGLSKDHRTEARTLRGQERPPRAPGGATCLAPGSAETAAAIREARLRRFGGVAEKTRTPDSARSSSDDVETLSWGVWKCIPCTLENNALSLSCEACTTPRPGWTCSDCTLENPAGAEKCEACCAPNPLVATAVGSSTSQFGAVNESFFGTPTHATAAVAISTSTASTAKKIACGACQQQGHNRASATPNNCPAYHFPEEVERRAQKKAEAERKAREIREDAARFEQQAQNDLQAAAMREREIRRLLEKSEQQSATFTEMAQGEAKRKHQAARRAEARARKLGG